MSELLNEIPGLDGLDNPDLIVPDTTELEALLTDTPVLAPEVGLEAVPIQFGSADDLEYYVNNCVFFDELLHPKQREWDTLDVEKTPQVVFLQANQEFWVVNRLLTIQKWEAMPETSKNWFYKKIISPTPAYPDNASAILMLTKLGSHMSQTDWDQYRTVFDKLFELHTEKLAKHPFPITSDELSQN